MKLENLYWGIRDNRLIFIKPMFELNIDRVLCIVYPSKVQGLPEERRFVPEFEAIPTRAHASIVRNQLILDDKTVAWPWNGCSIYVPKT